MVRNNIRAMVKAMMMRCMTIKKAAHVRSILGYISRTIKIIIPICTHSICILRKQKLRKFLVSYIICNLMPNRSPLRDEEPWITFEAREWLEKHLTQDMNVFEYGSGGSTIFFSRRVENLVSVEHDSTWYQIVLDTLTRKNILNCKYLLFEPHHTFDNYKQLDFTSFHSFASKEYPNMNFETYVKSINVFSNNSFDIVFIDGRARVSCIQYALDKVRHGCYLILDNSERYYYLSGKKLLDNWERKDFFGPGPYGCHFWQTSVWKKNETN